MRPEHILEHLEASPFQPFRIHTTDGKQFDITHPDLAIVTRHKVVVGIRHNHQRFADHVEHIALLHVVRLEELQSA